MIATITELTPETRATVRTGEAALDFARDGGSWRALGAPSCFSPAPAVLDALDAAEAAAWAERSRPIGERYDLDLMRELIETAENRTLAAEDRCRALRELSAGPFPELTRESADRALAKFGPLTTKEV